MEFTTHFELHSQTTRLVGDTSHVESGSHPGTGFSPSVTSCSKELGTALTPKMPLQITTRTPMAPDFKFELLPLHSQLLRQSLLVSFPPLIDMLKFSGYPYLIRGQTLKSWGFSGRKTGAPPREGQQCSYYAWARLLSASGFRRGAPDPTAELVRQDQAGTLELVLMTLEQACLPECRKAQCAFKDSMIH
jgi:hypothetical protein